MIQRRPAVVVLAAGRGIRFRGNGHKLAQRLDDDDSAALVDSDTDTVLARTVRHALATRLRVVIVTSAGLVPAAARLVPAADVVCVPEFDSKGRPLTVGMGYSIAAGVSATGDSEGWLIVPGDMPLLRPASMLAVAEALLHFPVAFAQYRGRRGHPVGFSTELFSELVNLQGDEGARRIVARYPSQAVELDDPGVLIDVDTVEDLARLRAQGLSQASLKPV